MELEKDLQIIAGGLQELVKDDRDFPLGAIIDLPRLEDLPSEFVVGLPSVVNQGTTDFCAAAASCAISEIQEGVPLSYEWQFAVAKMITGNPDEWGCDLRTMCKSHVKYGALEKVEAPYSLETKPATFLRRIENWPKELFDKASKHKKQSFFAVSGPYDHFDNLRATIYHFKDDKCGVLLGVIWSWPLSQTLMNTVSQNGFGHAMAGIGWDKDGLFIQNSAGEGAGIKGRHYFTREVINAFIDRYGAYCFLDVPREKAEWHLDNGIKLHDGWLIQFIKVALSITRSFFGLR